MLSVMVMIWMMIHLVCIICGENVKFYMNSCIEEELMLYNYHNYTGVLITDPPASMKGNSQSMFEYSYATKAIYGSVLDANLNYYPSNESESKFFHYFINVNNTGGLFLDIVDEKSSTAPKINATYCSDVELNNNALPSIIGAYFWLQNTNTFTSCRQATPIINGCNYVFNCTYPNPCNSTMIL
eukprot:467316_1